MIRSRADRWSCLMWVRGCMSWFGVGDGRAARRWERVRIFDPVAGGDALLVIDVGDEVKALVVFEDLATGELRLACGRWRCASSIRSRVARRCL